MECVDGHSLHAPFVYGFYNEVIKGNSDTAQFVGIENLRSEYLRDNHKLSIQDLGAGSTIDANIKRSIKSIAKKGITPVQDSMLLHRIIAYLNLEHLLELGTSLGINTLYLATNPSVQKVFTIEGCLETANVAEQSFQGMSKDKINLIKGNIDNAFSEIAFQTNQLDFIFIDANHTYEATKNYYNSCKRFINEDSVMVLDDIYWSEDMLKAWEEIKSDVEVTLSIDLYDMGIIFFKKHLQKEHYVISRS
jgi:predicted O-methyltransferase YrrM